MHLILDDLEVPRNLPRQTSMVTTTTEAPSDIPIALYPKRLKLPWQPTMAVLLGPIVMMTKSSISKRVCRTNGCLSDMWRVGYTRDSGFPVQKTDWGAWTSDRSGIRNWVYGKLYGYCTTRAFLHSLAKKEEKSRLTCRLNPFIYGNSETQVSGPGFGCRVSGTRFVT